MPSFPQDINLARTIINKRTAALVARNSAFENTKSGIASAQDLSKHVLKSVLVYGKPLVQTTFDSGKNALAIVLSYLRQELSQVPKLREIINALLANMKTLPPSGLEVGRLIMKPVIPPLLTLTNIAWDKIRQHPWVCAAVTGYTLLSLVWGPLWPLAAVLKVVGFRAEGVASGSQAARSQARHGNVAAGSWFALLQSLGARIGF